MMLILQGCRIEELQGHGSFHQDLKEKTGGIGSVWKGSVPKGKAPERVVWSPGETKASFEIPICWGKKNMEHLRKKAVGIEQSQLRREAVCSAKASGPHITLLCAGCQT